MVSVSVKCISVNDWDGTLLVIKKSCDFFLGFGRFVLFYCSTKHSH